MGKLEAKGVTVKQSIADADWLIISTAMDTGRLENDVPVVAVGAYTDLLVMLVGQATTDMDVYMLFCRIPWQMYSMREI